MLEVCVDSVGGLNAAVAGGAERIELCAALSLGGLTPSAGLIATAAKCTVPCRVLIRPRAGDFVYGAAEVALMCADIANVAEAGMAGVVVGAAAVDGGLDRAILRQFVEAAGGLPTTLHRVVDTLTNPVTAVGVAIDLGFDTILTSGGALCALQGVETLATMHKVAAGRVTIMAGAGVNAANLAEIARRTGIRHFHASCATTVETPAAIASMGFAPMQLRTTDAAQVSGLKKEIALLPRPSG